MYNINSVTIGHINHLNDIQLSQLLHILLDLEAQKFSLEGYDKSVPLNITSGDGGSDGIIQWNGNPTNTPRFCRKYTVIQNKATELSPKNCYDEILLPQVAGQKKKLKSEVEIAVTKKGSYILYTNKSITDSSKKKRIIEFRRAIKDAGKRDHAKFNIEVFDANTIKDWVNEFLPAVLLVQKFNGISRPEGFRSWEEVELDIKANLTTFQSNPHTDTSLKLLSDSITKEKVIRVYGHSGLGKTRLVFEAFRDNASTNPDLHKQFVYYDVGTSGELSKLSNYIISQRHHQSGVIIVDNCDSDTHVKLSELVKSQGEVKIITIGLDDSKSIDDNKIKLSRENQRDLVKKIINEKLGISHSDLDIDYVANLCEGYPWMAVRFCKVIQESGMSNFDKFLPEDATRKLLFGSRAFNETEYHIIRACSVFSAFGFLDDSFASVINSDYKDSLRKQMDFIRTQVCEDTVGETKFTETCQKFKNEDIIEKRGTFYIVKPTVLAIHLAAEWLTVTPREKIKTIIEHLKNVKLETKFLERLTDLDQLDKAKEIVEELWGPASFFGSAEVLNTAWGSLLFRYVVEVNPMQTSQTLVAAFKDKTKAELSAVVEGRRNLIWALEKLIFRNETFYEATQILFAFAVSENETWANNATSQIKQLFQRFLAGTEANYTDRIEVLDWALNKNDADYTAIAVSCIARAFIPQGQHHRSGGAENQGGGAPLVDYMPKTWQEIFDYWQNLINKLLTIARNDDESSNRAIKILIRAIRTMVSENAANMILDAIEKLEHIHSDLWTDLRGELNKTLKYESPVDPAIENRINKMLDRFEPKNIEEEFYSKIRLPEWGYDLGEKQKSVALNFADRVIGENIDWSSEISKLMRGEQRQTYNFAFRIGERATNAKQILNVALEQFKTIPMNEQNAGLIMGLINGINEPSLYLGMFDNFVSDRELSPLAINLAKSYEFPVGELARLFKLVDQAIMPVSYLANFTFGKPLSYLSKKDITTFTTQVSKYGKEGIWTAFSILFMHCYGEEDRWELYKNEIKKLLTSDNLIIGVSEIRIEPFYWSNAVTKLLNQTQDDKFAKLVSKQMAEFCLDHNFSYAINSSLDSVFQILFDQYFDVSWPAISATLTHDYISAMHLKSMIGTKNGSYGRDGVLFDNPDNYDKIYQWAQDNPKHIRAMANMMPLSYKSKVIEEETGKEIEHIEWHPFSRGFIEKFGDDEKMLNELSANMGSYGSVGSSVGYYQIQKQILTQLLSNKMLTVRKWAKAMIAYTDKSIKFESLDDEDSFFR